MVVADPAHTPSSPSPADLVIDSSNDEQGSSQHTLESIHTHTILVSTHRPASYTSVHAYAQDTCVHTQTSFIHLSPTCSIHTQTQPCVYICPQAKPCACNSHGRTSDLCIKGGLWLDLCSGRPHRLCPNTSICTNRIPSIKTSVKTTAGRWAVQRSQRLRGEGNLTCLAPLQVTEQREGLGSV